MDGKPVVAESADELKVLLSGDKGSATTLSLERLRSDGSVARLERAVKREKIGESTAVPAVFMLDQAAGIGYVDAPVSGGVAGAAAGTLAIMIGAPRQLFGRVKPLLEPIGKNIFLMGELPGQGHPDQQSPENHDE